MDVHVSLRAIQRVLLGIWSFLVLAGFLAEAWKYIVGRRDFMDIVYFFGLSYEQNLPTWYSSSLLLICSILLVLIGVAKLREKDSFRFHWLGLAAAFGYISLDETATLHEDLSRYFNFGGALYFGWVLPASAIVLVLAVLYLKFLVHLPQRTRRQFIVSAAFYVGGALGVEFLLGYWTDLAGNKNFIYGLIDLVEESMEILGITFFLCALLDVVGGEKKQLTVDLN